MKFEDLLKLYEKYKQKYKSEAYKHISELFDEAKRSRPNGLQKLTGSTINKFGYLL